MTFPLPPETDTESGDARRVGIELEMHGLDLDDIAGVVAEWVGGEIKRTSDYEVEITGDTLGPWAVEFDFDYLKRKGRKLEEQKAETVDDAGRDEGLLKTLDDTATDLLEATASTILPMEVVTPPIPMPRLAEVDILIDRLRRAGAKGTSSNLVYAFGTHLNPELPALDSSTITRYLKAFLCLYPWLLRQGDVDLVRRMTTFIEPFPNDYARHVCDPDYDPDLETLIDDYLATNATRNRALDMLPLFDHLDSERVRRVLDDPRIKPRPTLHYRLPNCEIDRPDWGIGDIWTDWLVVERLAADPDDLYELCARYREHLGRSLERLLGDWADQVDAWLDDR